MSYLQAITIFHTALSLLAIIVGVPAMIALFRTTGRSPATRLFLVLAIVTSVTGFLFPFRGVTPAVVTGVIALVVLAIVLLARRRALLGAWRWIHAAGMVISLYLLVFVGVVQAFQKIPALHRLAPGGTELPFVATQLVTLGLFVLLGLAAALRAPRKSQVAPIELIGVPAPRA